MSASLLLAATEIGPLEGDITATTINAASTATLLSSLASTAKAQSDGGFITMLAPNIMYYKFAVTNANVVDETATSGPTQCFALPAGVPTRVRIPKGALYLVYKGTAATLLRIYPSSSMAMA
jgi:hypothetical protein